MGAILVKEGWGIRAYDIIMTSSEPQKHVVLLWAQNQVMETFVNNSFSLGTSKSTFPIKIDKCYVTQ